MTADFEAADDLAEFAVSHRAELDALPRPIVKREQKRSAVDAAALMVAYERMRKLLTEDVK